MHLRKCLRPAVAFTGGLVAAQFVKQEFSKSLDLKASKTGLQIKVPAFALPTVFANDGHLAKSEPFREAQFRLQRDTGIEVPYWMKETPMKDYSIWYNALFNSPLVAHEYLSGAIGHTSYACDHWNRERRWPKAKEPQPPNSSWGLVQLAPARNHPDSPKWTYSVINAMLMNNAIRQGGWRQLEQHIRDKVTTEPTNVGVHVISGPFFQRGKDNPPTGYFKVIIEEKCPNAPKPYHMTVHIFRSNPKNNQIDYAQSTLKILDSLTGYEWNEAVKRQNVSGNF